LKMFIEREWVDRPKKIEVHNPYDNSIIDTVPKADRSDIDRALSSAELGAKVMAGLSGYERWSILKKAAEIMAARKEEIGTLISTDIGNEKRFHRCSKVSSNTALTAPDREAIGPKIVVER